MRVWIIEQQSGVDEFWGVYDIESGERLFSSPYLTACTTWAQNHGHVIVKTLTLG